MVTICKKEYPIDATLLWICNKQLSAMPSEIQYL